LDGLESSLFFESVEVENSLDEIYPTKAKRSCRPWDGSKPHAV